MERSIGQQAQKTGIGYIADRTPGNGQPIARLVTRPETGGEWGLCLDSGKRVTAPTDEPIYDEETAARQEATRRWGRPHA